MLKEIMKYIDDIGTTEQTFYLLVLLVLVATTISGVVASAVLLAMLISRSFLNAYFYFNVDRRRLLGIQLSRLFMKKGEAQIGKLRYRKEGKDIVVEKRLIEWYKESELMAINLSPINVENPRPRTRAAVRYIKLYTLLEIKTKINGSTKRVRKTT